MSEPSKRKRFSFSITSVLVFGSAGATFLAVGLVLFLGITSAVKNTKSLLYGQSEQMIDGLLKDISQELQPILRQLTWVAEKVSSGAVDPRDTLEWQRFIEGVPASTPQVIALGYVSRELQATVYPVRAGEVILADFSRFPALKKIMSSIKGPSAPQWFQPTLSPRRNSINLVAWIPLYRGGKLLGLYFQSVAAQALSRRLAGTNVQTGVTPFIIYDNNWVLMHPGIRRWQQKTGKIKRQPILAGTQDEIPLPELGEIGDPVIENIWTAEKAFIDKADGKSLTRARFQEIDGRGYIYIFRDIALYGARPWTVGAYFNEDFRIEELDQIKRLGFGGLAVLILAVLIAIQVGRLTSRPILRLAKAARAIQEGELDEIDLLPPSSLRELNDASHSFNEMVDGLRERERIRNLFGKYVPESVVEKMIASDEALAPQMAEATVLFVDLAGFTTLSENLAPDEIVTVLNDYFSAIVEIIERHDGVVTQFQGDAILAIYNVPVADPAHAEQAVATAREIHAVVEARIFGGYSLDCRVGINTGSVVAGNVGAEDRLNYTVHGDAVNTAARLEQMNKEFGTSTLIAESTAAASDTPLKKIGDMDIRGKSEKVAVYTFE